VIGVLAVIDLNVSYDGIQVLWNLSFDVKEGDVTAILGSNGSGKSTTLNTIMGLLKPSRGKILLNGKDITNYPVHKRVELGISIVPEGRKLFYLSTVEENLESGAFMKKGKRDFKDTLEWVYQLFPILKDRRKQKAGSLSGGEQQMLAIGRALMSNPKILMMDEPSLGLAPKFVLKVFDIIEEIRQTHITILIVEQHVHQVLSIADRAYVLENGRITLKSSDNAPEILQDKRIKKAYLGL